MVLPTQPLCLAYDEAKKEIFTAINSITKKQTIPLFMLEIIISDALRQIEAGAANEREKSKQIYEKALAEYKKEGD